MARKPYRTDVSDAEWSFVAPYLALLREDPTPSVAVLRQRAITPTPESPIASSTIVVGSGTGVAVTATFSLKLKRSGALGEYAVFTGTLTLAKSKGVERTKLREPGGKN